MRVTYCDTCGCPIKTNKFRLITAKYEENINCNLDSEAENFYNSKKGFIKEKEVEICENCYALLNKIFEHRMIKLLRLADDCTTLYEVPEKNKKNDTD
jgi:hypothetical protein